jgi:hypothetical protein
MREKIILREVDKKKDKKYINIQKSKIAYRRKEETHSRIIISIF